MMNTLEKWLVEPVSKIEKAEDRRHARLLSGLLLIVLLAVMGEWVFSGNIPIWIFFVLILAYGVSRYAYYPAVAMGCIIILCLPSFSVAMSIVEPTARQLILVFIWLIVPILLCSAFFMAKETAVVVAVCLLGIVVMPLLNPFITWSMIWVSFGFIATSGIILFVVMRQRDLSERERQAELEAKNSALQCEVTAHQQTEVALRQSEESAQRFQQQLITLQDVNIKLAQTDSFDELCRQAIVLGRNKLGFDRLGIWLLDESDSDYMLGSFGTDEIGNLSDERGLRLPVSPKEAFEIENPAEFPTKIWRKSVLYNSQHEVVGEGWSVLALLWWEGKIIGIISADNLVKKRPFSPEKLELLRLYASTLSHLLVHKQEEARATQRRIMLEKVVELGQQVTQVSDLKECLLTIYHSIHDGLGFDRVGLHLYDETNQTLSGTYGTDRQGNLREEWDLVVSVAELAPSGRPLYMIDNILFAQDFEATYGPVVKENRENMRGVKQHVRVVLWVGDQPVAVINVDNLVSQRLIIEEQVEALHLFGGYVGLAIENARLLTQVRDAEQRYRSIFENAAEGIFQVAREGHFLRANPALFDMFDYTSPANLIVDILDKESYVYADSEWLLALKKQLAASDRVINLEYELKRDNGRSVWVSQNVQAVYDDNGDLLYYEGTVQDITERKLAGEEREMLILELENRNAELERFTYTVSHDLKSPLITIQGFLGFVERDAIAGNLDRLKDDMARISSAAKRMQQLLDELLELSRVGRLINPSEVVAFADLVEDALELVSGRLMQIEMDVVLAPDLPAVFVDRRRVIEVLQNLLDNAAKFMGDQPEPRIDIGMKLDGAQTIFFVQDNGTGIAPAYKERVFGLFERLDQSVEGTGIGLALVKRIIEVHNGRLWVESAGIGQGSTFYFTLPLADEQNEIAGS